MIKTTLLLLLATSFSFSQTIVQTTPQNKKVILEEFTGVNCVYCPSGHTIANGIKNANPTNVFLINIHAGGFAVPSAGQPDFRTTFGNGIAGQAGITGYPAGSVNRTAFAGLSQNGGSGTAMGRQNWTNAANQTLAQSSYVNVATTASMNANTRVLTVLVEAYYTGSSPVSTNKLNVAFLQNNTFGPQTGGNMGSDYNHQHRLIAMITGQWGEDITTTTAGTFVTRTYTYTVPVNYNSVSAELGNFEVVAFIAETQQTIISGNGNTVTYTGLASNDTKVKEVKSIAAQCANTVSPKIVIQNYGSTNLTSATINYSVNGGANQTHNWTGNLASFASQTVDVNPITFNLTAVNTLNVSVPNDDNNANNSGSTSFNKAVETTTSNITVKIATDRYGSETNWVLKNAQGAVLLTSPTYFDQTTNGAFPQPDINITLPNDCYIFTINDTFGDGISSNAYGLGTYQIFSNGALMAGMSGGAFTSTESKTFSVSNPLGNQDFNANKITLYPNPSNGFVTISSEMDVNVSFYDISGKVVFVKSQVKNNETLNISNLQSGIYFAKLTSEISEETFKIILK